jgi:uncharacterized metal-binding protein YceD (DUF177 family)
MVDDRFKIYIHRLKEGLVETISETFDPSFMQVDEADLAFESPVIVKGQAGVSNNNFFITLSMETVATLRCIICNEPTKVAIRVKNVTHTQNMDELRSGLFMMTHLIRESVLLEIPLRAECGPDQCPERKQMTMYFSKEN